MPVNKKEREKRLKVLMEKLNRGDASQRAEATAHLMDQEKTKKISLPMLIEWSKSSEMSQAMYAITALGRNKSPQAVKQLLVLLNKHQDGNPLFVEVVVEALGNAGDHKAVAPLLKLLGVSAWRKLIKSSSNVIDLEKIPEKRKSIRLMVIRSLTSVIGPKDASCLGAFLHDEDPLVRWRTIELMVQSGCLEFVKDIEHLAKNDAHEVVQEKANIALIEMRKHNSPSRMIN